jgi:hypothetical protein
MTQEEKSLLLQNLCAMLPHRVKGIISFKHLSVLDDNKCAIFVRPFKVKGG